MRHGELFHPEIYEYFTLYVALHFPIERRTTSASLLPFFPSSFFPSHGWSVPLFAGVQIAREAGEERGFFHFQITLSPSSVKRSQTGITVLRLGVPSTEGGEGVVTAWMEAIAAAARDGGHRPGEEEGGYNGSNGTNGASRSTGGGGGGGVEGGSRYRRRLPL